VFLQSLIAVLATLLRLSPEELENVRKKRASNKGGLFGLF
jgi:predicted house-cleaning noncanonical NTP pyrophosphatase (MazG superfamily)